MERSLAFSMVIGATVDGSMRSAIGSTVTEMGRLGTAVRSVEESKASALKDAASIERTQRQLQAYREMGREVLAAGRSHRDAQDKVKGLAREIAAAADPTKAQEKALEAARKAVVRAAAAEEAKKQRLASMRSELKAANVDTARFGAAERKLASDLAAAKAKVDETTRSITAMGDAVSRVEKRQEIGGELRNQALKVGAAYLALRQPVREAGDFEHQLRRFGNTAGMTDQQLEAVRLKIRHVSVTARQGMADMMAGVDVLVGKGMKPDQALAAIEPIGLAASATGASMEDMANLSYNVLGNLHVPVDKLSQALDIMAQAGKEGGFELRDMAREFPQLTSAAAALGWTGTEAVASLGAALQVAMRGASDPSTAANNLANFLAKIASPETVKNFSKLGIDIQEALAEGVAAGQNPMEVVMQQIAEATGADLGKAMEGAFDANGKLMEGAAEQIASRFDLGSLFGDRQVQDFLAPMLANYQEYVRIKNTAAQANGVVNKDFAAMAGTFNKASERLGVAWSNIKEGIGASLLPVLTPVTNVVAAAAEGIADLTEQFPVLTAGVVTLGGGVLAFRSATLVARYGMTFLRGGIGSVVKETMTMGRAVGGTTASVGRMGASVSATGGRLGAVVAQMRRYSVAANSAATASRRLATAQGGIGSIGGLGGIGKTMRVGGKALGAAGLLLNAGLAVKDMADPSLSREEKGASVGDLAGGLAGAATGAAIGSVVPVIGTAVGAMIGGVVGSMGGSKLGAMLGREGVGQAVGGAMAATAAAGVAMSPPPQVPFEIEQAVPSSPTTMNTTINITIPRQQGDDAQVIAMEVRRQIDDLFQDIGGRQRAGLYDVV
ncbi:hypothetical protein KL86APRO_11372 [uncultured Alphaproteobacteria bacterium]|uniref:Phage tail tape measure protein domain-containing protein n=1 Tax=uncultured Alphaproteobacteria bacterium TaxID=91750 RepID=A0A212JNM0_9PROT|nr:hypothetical protein KL86APRO_11372 [uncultured Alphaproteobacteria bacterium]